MSIFAGCAEDAQPNLVVQGEPINWDLTLSKVELMVDGKPIPEISPYEIKGSRDISIKLNISTSLTAKAQRVFVTKDSDQKITIDIHSDNGTAKEMYESAMTYAALLKINPNANERIKNWYDIAGQKEGFSHAETFGGGIDRPCGSIEILNSFNKEKPYYLSVSFSP
jgi:hypothetical protein